MEAGCIEGRTDLRSDRLRCLAVDDESDASPNRNGEVPPVAATVDMQRSDGRVGTEVSPKHVGRTLECIPAGLSAAAAGMHGLKGLVETRTKSGYIGKGGRQPPKPSAEALDKPEVCGACGFPHVVATRPQTGKIFRF